MLQDNFPLVCNIVGMRIAIDVVKTHTYFGLTCQGVLVFMGGVIFECWVLHVLRQPTVVSYLKNITWLFYYCVYSEIGPVEEGGSPCPDVAVLEPVLLFQWNGRSTMAGTPRP